MKKFYKLGKNVLFPICRSLTGNGVRKTLNIIKKELPNLKIKKVRSGTKVFDWKIPKEWNIDDFTSGREKLLFMIKSLGLC